MERGEGAYVWDTDGRRYIDGLAGLFVVQAGHGRKELAAAAAAQAEKLAYYPLWTYAHPAAIELAARLAAMAPGDLNRVFFTTGGGEAVESAWKLARSYFLADGPARPGEGGRPARPRTTAPRSGRWPSPGSRPSRSRSSRCSTARPATSPPPTRQHCQSCGGRVHAGLRRRHRAHHPRGGPGDGGRRLPRARAERRRAASCRPTATSPGSARSATATACSSSPTR